MSGHDKVTPFQVTSNRLSCYFTKESPVDFLEPFAIYMAKTNQTCVADAAFQRVSACHALYQRSDRHSAGVAALVGFWIDCHIPAIRWEESLQFLYKDHQAPEQQSAFPVCCYPVSVHREQAVKAWHSHMYNEVTDLTFKLMRKGGPAPLSVRYVSGLLKRCAASPPHIADVVRCIVISNLLGNYQHSAHCGDPAFRIQLYNKSTVDLIDSACQKMTTRQLHNLLTEFVAANTLLPEHQALLKSIEILDDSSIAAPQRCLFGPATAWKHTTPVAYNVFNILLKSLNVHHTTLTITKKLLGDATALRIIQIAIDQNLLGISARALHSLGLSAVEIECIRNCTTRRKYGTLKMMRIALKALTIRSRQVLCLFMWTMRQKLSVSVSALPLRVKLMQSKAYNVDHPGVPPIVVVCLVCASVKMNVDGIRVAKTRVGVAVNPVTGVLSCNACHMPHVKKINLLGRTCTIGQLGRPARNRVVICCRCAKITTNTDVLGIYPLCRTCFEACRATVFRPKLCLCGREAKANDSDDCWLIAKDGRDVTCFALCHLHAHLNVDTLVNVDALIHHMQS